MEYDVTEKPEPCYRHWGHGYDRWCEFCQKLNPVEAELMKMYTRYVRPSSPWWGESYRYEETPRGHEATRARYQELLDQWKTVKCGYGTTSVQGHHVHHFFYK